MKQLILPLLLSLFINCAYVARRPSLSTENITIREIMNRIEHNHLKLSALKGKAHISIESSRMNFSALGSISLKMPDSLIIQVKAGIGMGLGSILVNHDLFTVYSPTENTVYTGNSDALNLIQFFQVNLNLSDLFNFISGIPLIDEAEKFAFDVDQNKYQITTHTNDQTKKYWIDPEKFVITDIHIYDSNGQLFIKQEFRRFGKEKGVYLPKIIRIHYPKGKDRLTLMYTDRRTNKKVDPKDFILHIPENTHKVNL